MTLTTPVATDANTMLNGGNAFRETMPRDAANSNTIALAATGVMASYPIRCLAGDVITNVTLRWGTTGAATPTHWWFAFYDTQATPALIDQTADQTSTVITAASNTTLALGSPRTLTVSGIYRVAVMVASAAMPNVCGRNLGTGGLSTAVVSGQVALSQTSGSALTTTAPGTIASPGTTGGNAYVVLS